MSGHTPGPWRVVQHRDFPNVAGPRWDESDPYFHRIAEPLAWLDGDRGPTLDEVKANASLIAAAPDLLAALKYARARLGTCARTHGSDDEAVDALLEPINAAIAKAEQP